MGKDINELLSEFTIVKDSIKYHKKDDFFKIENSRNQKKDTILQKWDKKLQHLDEDDKIKLGYILENQHRVLKDISASKDLDRNKILEKIELCGEELSQNIEKIKIEYNRPETNVLKIERLTKSSESLKEEILSLVLEKDKDNTPDYLVGVNIIDEVVKWYDCLQIKRICGIQPMMGPVGLAYALRFRADIDMPKFEENAVVVEHTMQEIGLTVEQKEIKADTHEFKLDNKKLSGEELARKVDDYYFNTLLLNLSSKLKTYNYRMVVTSMNTFITAMYSTSEQIYKDTKMGQANFLVVNKDGWFATFLKFSTPEVSNKLKGNFHMVYWDGLDEDKFIMGYKGKRENDCGAMFCPYVPILILKMLDNDIPEYKIMSRNGFMLNLYGSEKYYSLGTVEVTNYDYKVDGDLHITVDKSEIKTEFTAEQIKNIVVCKNDIQKFLPVCKVVHPIQGLVSLEDRNYLKRILNVFQTEKNIIANIERQKGKSSMVTMYALWYAMFNNDSKIMICCPKMEMAWCNLRTIKTMYENLPSYLKPSCRVYNKSEIVFDNGSSIRVSNCKDHVFRGLSLNLVILDEPPASPAKDMSIFYGSIPPSLHTTNGKLIIMESLNCGKSFQGIYEEENNFTKISYLNNKLSIKYN